MFEKKQKNFESTQILKKLKPHNTSYLDSYVVLTFYFYPNLLFTSYYDFFYIV